MPRSATQPLSLPEAPLELSRGVYRCTHLVPGFVTYYAVTYMGNILGELRDVRPGTVSEARVAVALRRALHAHDGHVKVRPPLKLVGRHASKRTS